MRAHRRHSRATGSAVLYTIVLSPILMLCLALALEAGALQLQKARLRSAGDVAASAAIASVSDSTGGAARLDEARADSTARQALRDNLQPLEAQIVGSDASGIADAADVTMVTSVPRLDPYDAGTTLTRPTLLVRMRVPVSSGLLSLAGLPRVLTLTIVSSADLRVTGAGAP